MKKWRVVSNDWDNASRYPQRGRLEPTAGEGSLAGPIDVVRTTLFGVRWQSPKAASPQDGGPLPPDASRTECFGFSLAI
jgi:hypothetical protein